MARHVGAYADEWRATLEDPEKLRAVRVVRQRARTRPTRASPSATERDQRRAGRAGDAGRSLLGRDDRRCGTAATTLDAGLPARRASQPERGVAALVDGAAGRGLPDARRQRVRDRQLDPLPAPTVLARGIVGTRGDIPVRRLTDAQAGLRPAHRQCLDDAAVRVPTYDVRVDDGRGPRRPPQETVRDRRASRWHGFRVGVTAAAQGRRAGRAARAPRRRGRVGAGAVGRATASTTASCSAATEEVLAGRVDLFLATTGIGMRRGSRRPRGGGCSPPCSRRSARRRSWPAAPRASGRCAAAGCASSGRRTRSASTTCSRTCAAATSRAADRRAGARPVAVDGGPRPAPAGRRRDHGDRLPGRVRRPTRSRCSGWSTWSPTATSTR